MEIFNYKGFPCLVVEKWVRTENTEKSEAYQVHTFLTVIFKNTKIELDLRNNGTIFEAVHIKDERLHILGFTRTV